MKRFWISYDEFENIYNVGMFFSYNPGQIYAWKRKIITCEEFNIAEGVKNKYYFSLPKNEVGGSYWNRPCQKSLMDVCPDFFNLAWKAYNNDFFSLA
jgi:hypothetical protein